MSNLLPAARKIQQWIKAHPRKATIVYSVLKEFDDAIEKEGSEIEELKEFIRDVLGLPGIQLNEAREWVEDFCKKHGI